jgi:hypothetical protein
MNAEQLQKLEDSYSFDRPGQIVGQIINEAVARLAVEKLTAKGISTERAIEILRSVNTRHAYDRAAVEFPPAHRNALDAIAREIASALVVRLEMDGAAPSDETLAHSRRVDAVTQAAINRTDEQMMRGAQ